MRIVSPLTLFLFIMLAAISTSAQQQLEDVIYLKDGSIYRGVIIEEVPGQNRKIQIMGGSVVSVQEGDIEKVAKEEPYTLAPEGRAPREPRQAREPRAPREKLPFVPRTRGYFFQGQLLIENLQGGLRVVNGYRFGRFGHLGIGVGFDLTGGSPLNTVVNGVDYTSFGSVYLPLYLYYAGDILSKKVTPFYQLEAGYALPLFKTEDYLNYEEDYYYSGSYTSLRSGGAMGALGLGVRFNTSRRINFSLLLNVNFKMVQYQEYYSTYDESSGIYYTQSSALKYGTMLFPGLRFGIGF